MRKLSDYDDIIDLPRPKLQHSRQPQNLRAAQFAPFAALVGFYEEVLKTERGYLAEMENETVVEVDEDAQGFDETGSGAELDETGLDATTTDDEYVGGEF